MNQHVSTASSTSGVWGSSTPVITESFAIFCVGNDKIREAAFRSWATNEGIGFKSLQGCYKGVQEASFIVNLNNLDKCRPWWEKEESVLVLGPTYRDGQVWGTRLATLKFVGKDGEFTSEEYLGHWRWDLGEAARKLDAWTYDPTEGAYYTVQKELGA